MPKKSAYSHFQPWYDGFYIAYNAASGGVAMMTGENYEMYLRMMDKLAAQPDLPLNEEEQKLLGQLQYGKFVREDNCDELDAMKFQHNLGRFDRTSLGLVIAPTMACNMACQYCYEENKTGRMSEEVRKAIVDMVEKQGRNLAALSVTWYGGEPLLAPDIIEDLSGSFIKLSEQLLFNYSASIVSNGYLLTAETVDRLVALKVGGAQITLDGPARMHNVKRPLKNARGGSFDAIIENLKYASTKMSIGIRVNVDKSFSIDTINELLTELESAGLRERIGVYFGRLEASTKVCANISESCHDVMDFSKVETDYFRLLLQRGYRIDKLPAPRAVYCMAQSINAFVIDPGGYLYRCWNYVGDPQHAMGNIKESIDYQNPNFKHLFGFDPFTVELCRNCNLLPVCLGGCPARRTDHNLSGAQMCESWKYNLQPMLEIIATSRQRQAQQAAKEQS